MTEIFDPILHFDLRIFEWIQTVQGTFLDKIMVAITTLGEGGIIFILLALALICTKKYRKAGVAVLVALVVMEVGNNLILKEIFARPRPFNLAGVDPVKYAWWAEAYRFPGLVSEPTSYSFPSGHTSSAFAAAIAVLWYDRKIGIPTTVFAFIMGFTRIYVEVHYPSDVIAGAVVGVVYALLGVLIMKFLYPQLEKLFARLSEKKKNEKGDAIKVSGMEKIKKLFHALLNKETITYVIFGVLTTLVNLVVFKAFDVIFGGRLYLLTNSIAWVAAVVFAYITNKLFVFESKSWAFSVLKKEIPSFFGARIASYFIEQAGLWFFVEMLHFDKKVFGFIVIRLGGKIVAKLILGVLVVIINYVLSKFIIFAKKDKPEKTASEE